MVTEDLKQRILSDENILKNVGIYLFYNFNKSESKKDDFKTFDLDTYNFYNWYLYNKEDTQQLRDSIKDIVEKALTDTMLNNVYDTYKELAFNTKMDFITTLSRLFYVQNKYKDDVVGQEIEETIKFITNYIKNLDENSLNDIKIENKTQEELDIINKQLVAHNLFNLIPRIAYEISTYNKSNKKFVDFWESELNIDDVIGFLNFSLYNTLKECNLIKELSDKINLFINDTIGKHQFNDFLIAKDKELDLIIKEYIANDNNETTLRLLLGLKGKTNIDDLIDEEIEQQLTDPVFNKIYDIYAEYQSTDNYLKYDANMEDVKKWRKTANIFIQKLQDLNSVSLMDLDLDYILKHLTYNTNQFKQYKTDIKPNYEKKRKRLTNEQLKEKYQEATLLNGMALNPNKKWAIIDTNKLNNNIMNIREAIGKKVDSNTDITQRKINELLKIPKPTKRDLEKLKELKETLKQQEEDNKILKDEIKELEADISLLNKQITSEPNGNELKRLNRIRKAKERELNNKKETLNKNGLFFQLTLDGKLRYAKENKRKKEKYTLIVNADYDVTNFNQEGRNFIQYIPNIPNIVEELNKDYITIDLDHYVDFNGISNPQRTRKRLLETLTEMRKESYEYSYYDEKGALQEGSLVLIGDVMTTEYKGKATLMVQLGGQFKRNIQQAIIKGNIAHVNKEVFKIGHGKNNKKEYMAKELYFYFVRLARTEAKKGLTKGTYQKALKLDTIITFLADINLINYNPNRYNETVKEPLQTALYTGQELGLFSIKTDAFKYYDDVINTLNNGANVKDKVKTFENELIQVTIFNDNTDLESNQKAFETYKANKNKYKKEATKN